MSGSEQEESLDENRRLAEKVLSSFELTQERILNQHVDQFKWINASLLTINGAMAIAVMNSSKLPTDHKLASCSFFGIGVLLALLVAVLGQKFNERSLKPVSNLTGYWMTVCADGLRGMDLEKELNDELAKATKWSWVVPAIGWLSALVFVLGGGIVGLGMKTFDGQQNCPVCVKPTQ